MYYYRTVLQIYCVIPPHPSNLLGSEPPGANPALKPRETGQAYPRLQVIRTVRVDNITPLGKVTVTLVRLENCIHQSKLQGAAEGPMENAAGFLIIPAPRWWGETPGGSDPFS